MSEENNKSKDVNVGGEKSIKTDRTSKDKTKRGGRRLSHQMYKLDEVDHKLLRQLMEYPETTQKELAKMVGFSPSGLKKRIDRPAFKNAMKDIHLKTMDIFLKAQKLAARKLMKLVQSDDEQVALKACGMVMAPLINQATLNVNASVEKVYRVRFGEQGQMYQEVLDLEAEPEEPKTSLDLLKEAGKA